MKRLGDSAAAAREAGDASSVISANTQIALNFLALGDLDEATKACRRASRMARTESFPQLEYLTNWALARIRRSAGSPHLALHILQRLAVSAPAPWEHLIGLERCLAGSRLEPGDGSARQLWLLRAFAEQQHGMGVLHWISPLRRGGYV